jgi:hypothetical protein
MTCPSIGLGGARRRSRHSCHLVGDSGDAGAEHRPLLPWDSLPGAQEPIPRRTPRPIMPGPRRAARAICAAAMSRDRRPSRPNTWLGLVRCHAVPESRPRRYQAQARNNTGVSMSPGSVATAPVPRPRARGRSSRAGVQSDHPATRRSGPEAPSWVDVTEFFRAQHSRLSAAPGPRPVSVTSSRLMVVRPSRSTARLL